tara:strand:- start:11281 stop:11502 length:222 start_codon:yes stop_codon:yes gene_type:complete
MNKLDWTGIRNLGKTDNANRWHPIPAIAPYFDSIRAPSRAWPNSYAKAAQTLRFAKWLKEHHPTIAQNAGLEA